MAVNFTQVIQDNVLVPLESLIKAEFTKLPIFFDTNFKVRNNFFIRIIPIGDSLDKLTTEDQLRQYQILLRFYRRTPGRFTRDNNFTNLMNAVDRMKRLIGNNSNYKPSDVYKWNDAAITRVNYQPEKEDTEKEYQVVDMIFECNVLV